MPVVNGKVAYLVDDEAIDVSRITGIPWYYQRVHQRGALHPFIDLTDLGWWDRFRVAWTLIGGHYYLNHESTDACRTDCALGVRTGAVCAEGGQQ